MPSTMSSPPREKREAVVHGKRRRNVTNRERRLCVEGTVAGGWYGLGVALSVNDRQEAVWTSVGERPPSPGGERKTKHLKTPCCRSGARHSSPTSWRCGKELRTAAQIPASPEYTVDRAPIGRRYCCSGRGKFGSDHSTGRQSESIRSWWRDRRHHQRSIDESCDPGHCQHRKKAASDFGADGPKTFRSPWRFAKPPSGQRNHRGKRRASDVLQADRFPESVPSKGQRLCQDATTLVGRTSRVTRHAREIFHFKFA